MQGYSELLAHLSSHGYALHPASEIGMHAGRAVFLRHDVDLHLAGALDMAAVEESHGARSTWYIGTRLAYNPAYGPNAEVIRALADRGHSIGLHYVGGQRRIAADLGLLEEVAGVPVDTWVMHEPSAGGADYCRGAGNPHSYGVHYVSDSGMRWHDPWVSALLAGEPERAMLNTHHEHWIGGGNREARAEGIRADALRPQQEYLDHLLRGYGGCTYGASSKTPATSIPGSGIGTSTSTGRLSWTRPQLSSLEALSDPRS